MDELDNLLQDLEVSKSERSTAGGTEDRQARQEEDLASLISDIRKTEAVPSRATQDTSLSSHASVAGYTPAAQPQSFQIEEVVLQPANAAPAPSYSAPASDYMAAPQRVPQRAVITKVKPAPAPVMVQPQSIQIEEVNVPAPLPAIGYGGQNRYDAKDSTFSNYVEPPKAATLVEDPREHQVNAIVKKLIASIQGPKVPDVVQSLKTIPVLARSEANLRSMKKGNLIHVLFQLMNTSPHETVIEWAGKSVEGLMNIVPDGLVPDIQAAGGVQIIIAQCSHSHPGVALQALRLLSKLARKSADKRSVAQPSMPLLVKLLSDAHAGVRHQACSIIYYLFESASTHNLLIEKNGAKPLLGLLNSPPGTQVWALGTIGRLAGTPSAFAALESAGLEISLVDITSSRAALIQNAINILNGAGDTRSKFVRVEQEVRSTLEQEGNK